MLVIKYVCLVFMDSSHKFLINREFYSLKQAPALLQGIPLLFRDHVKTCCLGFSTFPGNRTGTIILMVL